MLFHKEKSILLACALLASCLALAQENSAKTGAEEPTESQLAARGLVLEMAAYLGGAPEYQVDMRITYDTMQANGQKIEFGEHRKVSLQRPSHVLNESQASDGKRETVLFDGQWITVSEAQSQVYARTAQLGDIDTTVRFFLGQLGMRLPLAVMLMSQFPDVLERRMQSIEFVEETDFPGEPTYHLAGRTKDVDFQVWISAAEHPLPLRIVLTYREAAGQPEFRADFSNWNFNPAFAAGLFEFKPPAGASEIPLLAHILTDSANTNSVTAPTTPGEQP